MYKNILVPIALDHERDTNTALDVARALCVKGGKITALNVIDQLPSYATEYLPVDHAQNQEDGISNAITDVVGGAADVSVAVIHGHSGRTIVEYADDNNVDLIVIASHRPGLQDYFLGSTAARVVRHAPCAVHVVR
jgi:nucleotide-binding universal stress UspA family protein